MNHLDFIVWMIGFPITATIVEAVEWNYCKRKEYSEDTEKLASTLLFLIWVGVGIALW